jgi:hypothetical protein
VVQGHQEPKKTQLQSLKKQIKKKKKRGKKTEFERLREGSRGVRGADGSGWILGKQETCEQQDTNMKSTFLGLFQNLVKKRQKIVQSRRLARKKNEKRLGYKSRGGVERGTWSTCCTFDGAWGPSAT